MPMTVVDEQIAARRNTVRAFDGTASNEQIWMAVAIEVAYGDARSALGHAWKGMGIASKVPVSVVDVQSVLQRVVGAGKLMAPAHDVEIQLAIAVGVEELRVHVFEEAVRMDRRLVADVKDPVAPLDKQRAWLPLGTANVYVIESVAVHVTDRERRALRRQLAREERLPVE